MPFLDTYKKQQAAPTEQELDEEIKKLLNYREKSILVKVLKNPAKKRLALLAAQKIV